MPLTVSPDLLILAFVGGFALATLIFWPLLHRAHRPATVSGSRGSVSTGKHALGTRGTTKAAGLTTLAATRAARNPAEIAPGDKSSAGDRGFTVRTADPEGAATPVRHEEEPADAELAPNDLFEQHHAAKFDQARQRLTRVRAELGGS